MATSVDYIEFVCEQIRDCGKIRYRKMFGEYMVYVNEKPVLLVCDNTVYVKMIEAVSELMKDAEKGFPYDGAKEHYILDIENNELVNEVIPVIEMNTPVKASKQKKQKLISGK